MSLHYNYIEAVVVLKVFRIPLRFATCLSLGCCDVAGAELQLGKSRWLDLDRGIVTSTPNVHSAIIKAIGHSQELTS